MKKILYGLILIGSGLSAQVLSNGDINSQLANTNYFLDATNFQSLGSESQGRLLGFPKTDLTKFEFDLKTIQNDVTLSGFDGVLVYNTVEGYVNEDGNNAETKGQKVKVTPGFYYFSNPNGAVSQSVAEGKWVRIADANDLVNGVAGGKYWSLNGNSNTTPVTIDDMKDAKNKDYTQRDYSFNPEGKNFIGTTDDKTVTIATGKKNPTDEYKNVAHLTIGKIPERTVGGSNFNFVMEVYGKAHFEDGIVTKASTYPDYVFDHYFTGKSAENPNYQFKSLSQVEKFIKENNHLPGVTSIKDLSKSETGYQVDNTQLSIQTLEKVEELYLHIIEQQKEIEALKAELQALKK
ncbi:hypothetical protein ACT4R9_08285 [Ornithobacterium rhinotracheale]|uniref:hypothetical protein n=1 Tax=Ornithobacterium rhinotracheale TaxID=28251 RepID=UPI003FA40B6D